MKTLLFDAAQAAHITSDVVAGLVLTAWSSVMGPPEGERKQSQMSNLKAWSGVITLSAMIFGSGVGFAIWGLGFAEAPEKLQTVEIRLDRVESQLHTLVCELRAERGAPEEPSCITGVLR